MSQSRIAVFCSDIVATIDSSGDKSEIWHLFQRLKMKTDFSDGLHNAFATMEIIVFLLWV
ncbi:MAG: hypothetical protein ACPGGG_05055 [Parvibaculales bacterium]